MRMTGSNRRAFPRVNTEVPIEVVRADRPDGRIIRATLQDISQTGMMIAVTEAIPSGEWLIIRPDRKGAGYGTEVTAVVERNATPNEPVAKLICRFPTPLDYGTLQLFR